MGKYATGLLLFFLSGIGSADEWAFVSSKDAFWIKTVNIDKHELLVAYHEDKPQFLLILKTESKEPNKPVPVSIKIDSGPKKPGHLVFLEKRPEQIIFRIEIDEEEKDITIDQMVAGLVWSIYFDSESASKSSTSKAALQAIQFTLKGFTVALNDLMIGNDIGSLDPGWLMQHKKDRELYCLMTTEISIKAMQYRTKGETYNNTLHLIPKTNYSIIDHNLADIISQVYNLPLKDLPCVPRAEKYLMFSRCMSQPWRPRNN